MKSILISLIMFAVILGAMYIGVFDVTSSVYVLVFATIVLAVAFGYALKVLGNPFAKDKKNDHK